mmetsp:Transcript_8937/g.17274  ORF Transcript_8937/g.17274 Transcript_8937/m.17274 type:complete len:460 (-) Transcript_8937:53-1432(-)
MQKGGFVVGVAQGLSPHSSLHEEFKSLFHSSNEVELSSIKKQHNTSSQSEAQLFKKLVHQCRFCNQGELFDHRLIRVCKCANECWGHESCVIKKKEKKKRCATCKSDWIVAYERESQLSHQPHVSFLQSIEESAEVGVSSIKRSTISESSGEERMRNIIQAATLKAFCRICKSDFDSADNRLIYPCQCHTIRPQESWAHRKCIKENLLLRQSDTCERCKVKYALSYEPERMWCCKEFMRSQAFVAQLALLVTGMALLSCLIALLTSDALDYSDGEQAWAYFLIAFCSILLILFLFALGLVVWQNSKKLHIKEVYVLCQKQEIAQMTSKSHLIFLAFLAMNEHRFQAKREVLQPTLPSSRKNSLKHKSITPRVISNPIFEEPERTERSDDSLNPQERDFSPILAVSQTHEENANSEDLQEHSVVRESLVMLEIEDFKNHSFSVISRVGPEEERKLHSFSS